MLTGSVSAINTDGTVMITVDQTNQVIRSDPYAMGGKNTNLEFGPSVGDIVLLDDYHNTYILMHHSRPDTFSKGRYADSSGNRTLLNEGEWVIRAMAGQQIYLDSLGNIRLMPGAHGKIYLGNDTSGLQVARVGDIVTGTDSHGDTVTGTITSGSNVTYSD